MLLGDSYDDIYTAYKVERRSGNGQVIAINPSGTSQKCSGCGMVVPKEKKLDLSIRTFGCQICALALDRDHNAAINIFKLGLEQAHAQGQPILILRKRISKFASMKQETNGFIRG